jgi:invasion protein IalB
MIVCKWHCFGVIVGGLSLASSVALWAQAPQHTTATYDDWILRCDMTSASKNCDLAQSTQAQGQAISLIVIGRPSKAEPLRIIVQVPINVWLPSGVRLASDKDSDLVSATFKRCLGGGCFADAELKDDVIKKLRSETENGKLLFKDAAQKEMALPVSFKGFAVAFDALVKQTQDKQ